MKLLVVSYREPRRMPWVFSTSSRGWYHENVKRGESAMEVRCVSSIEEAAEYIAYRLNVDLAADHSHTIIEDVEHPFFCSDTMEPHGIEVRGQTLIANAAAEWTVLDFAPGNIFWPTTGRRVTTKKLERAAALTERLTALIEKELFPNEKKRQKFIRKFSEKR